ncbi:MAG: chromate efflux transporter [Chloroflexota bacterium]
MQGKQEAVSEQEVGGRSSLREVATLFLKLGIIGFGGPAAHIALMREEVVRRRRWLSDQRFLDLVGASNLVPGPTSTELAIYLGLVRAGWPGLVVAGTLFILPAMLIVLGVAWAYTQYGTLPQATAALYGIKPAIMAVVVQALWGLGRTAVKNVPLAVIGAATLALHLAGGDPVALLFGGALLVMLWARMGRGGGFASAGLLVWPWGLPAALPAAVGTVSLVTLFLTFFKIGLVVYGSGYVLLAFLRDDLVHQLGWLSESQLLDAVAVGQFTPGPVFTTATFVGYLVAGLPGALLATLAIFLPSFIFVVAVHPLVSRLRASPWTAAFLDGANVASLGLMAAVTWQLGQAALVDLPTVLIAVAAWVLLMRWRVNSAWLVLGGALVGLAVKALLG